MTVGSRGEWIANRSAGLPRAQQDRTDGLHCVLMQRRAHTDETLGQSVQTYLLWEIQSQQGLAHGREMHTVDNARAVNGATDRDLVGSIAEYYTQVSPDYTAWSRNLNMHFGVWRRGMSLFDREAMLEQMNKEVLAHGMRPPEPPKQLLDLGCGAGAVARMAAEYFPGSTVIGIALAPPELKRAARLTPRQLSHRVRFVAGDYLCMPFCGGGFDMAVALGRRVDVAG